MILLLKLKWMVGRICSEYTDFLEFSRVRTTDGLVLHCTEHQGFNVLSYTLLGAGIAHWYSYGLVDREVRVTAWVGNFSLHHRVQTDSGAHTASYPMGTRGCFPGAKATGS
jgi:hypothetical protein